LKPEDQGLRKELATTKRALSSRYVRGGGSKGVKEEKKLGEK